VSVADGTSVIPPGWYEDPADPARLRRWDGQQWTQEVLLAPEQAPAVQTAPPTAPPSMQPTYAEPPAPPQAEPDPPQYQSPPQPAPTVQAPASNVPPVGQPVPASPAPTSAPPGAPASTPTGDADPVQPTTPRPSPPVNQHPNPSSGPVSLPEWANLPGLTRPPDLSSLPGMESNSILNAPTFEAPAFEVPVSQAPTFEVPVFERTPYEATEQRAAPKQPVFEPPFIPQRPDVQQAGSARTAATNQPSAEPEAQVPAPAPATPYAPPPAGPHYDVPPPPGMAHVPSTGPALPPSAFVAPQLPSSSFPQLPPVGATPPVAGPVVQAPPSSRPVVGFPAATAQTTENLGTISIWLIAALPLLQFAVVYVVFGLLHVTLAPGMQWGILAVPAAFSLLFANADKKKLTELGAPSPSIILGLLAPAYLIARCFTTGRSSLLPLIAWVVLQAGAAAGVYFLLPKVLAVAVHAIG